LKTSHATHWHSCVSRQSELCSERFVINNQLLGQTLRQVWAIIRATFIGTQKGDLATKNLHSGASRLRHFQRPPHQQ
jgi:hypothetical protein